MDLISFRRLPNARPYLHGDEEAAAAEVLRSGQYGHGPVTEEFECRLAELLGVPDIVAVASGTAALHIALLTAGVGPGDEVVVPSLTFAATVQAILATGARPVWCEIDPRTLCVTPPILLQALTPRTRAVLPVLYGGRAIDLTPIRDILDQRGIAVVEDAAHAFGSRTRRDGRHVGGTGALTCFSFDPIKNLTCGDGGAVVPRTPGEGVTARRLRGLGIEQDARKRASATTYDVTGFGLRAHLPALNAAIGLVQLRHFAAVAR